MDFVEEVKNIKVRNEEFRKKIEELHEDNKELRKDNKELRKDNEEFRKDNKELQCQIFLINNQPYLSELVSEVFKKLIPGVKSHKGRPFTGVGDFFGYFDDRNIDVAYRKQAFAGLLKNAVKLIGLTESDCHVYIKCLRDFKISRNNSQHPNLDKVTCRHIVAKCFKTGTTEFNAFTFFLEELDINESKEEYDDIF
jgi:hypothetical protein